MRIQGAQNQMDPTDPDPDAEHWLQVMLIINKNLASLYLQERKKTLF